MSATLAALDPAVASAYAKAQSRMRVSAAMAFCDQYHPLMAVVNEARHWGGGHTAKAVAACEAIAAADEPALARMTQMRRAAPDSPSGVEITQATHAARAASVQVVADTLAIGLRPRLSLAEQLAMMEARGFKFAVYKAELHVSPPAMGMTPADRALFREHKAAIVASLSHAIEVF